MEAMDIFLKLLMGVLGILIFAIIAVKDKLKNFNINIWWRENIIFWAWTLTMFVAIFLVILIEPEAAGAIKTITGGIDLEDSKQGWLMFTFGLSGLVNVSVKDPIGKKPQI